MPYNPKSLANLKPWTSESAPRHPRSGGSWGPGDFLRFLQAPDMTAEALRTIANDSKQPQGRRVAAQMMLDGTDPDARVRGAAAERLIDRLEGTPIKSIRTIDESVPDPVRILAEIRAGLVGADRQRFEQLASPAGLTLAPAVEPERPQRPSSSAYGGSSSIKYHGRSATK